MLILNDNDPRGLGYYMVDHRACEIGIPAAGGGYLFEADTYTCRHCERVVVLNPDRKRERYKCHGCNHHICDNCAALRTAGAPCMTFLQKLELVLTEDERRSEVEPNPTAV